MVKGTVERMTGTELKNTTILAVIFALRMVGLFMILPVLPLYIGKINGATPALIGVAAGIYGLTQALLQFPLGWLSDYIGRKRVIAFSLMIFSIGSLIASFSSSIAGIILGRAVQGMGAVGSPLLALVADVTRQEVRTRAMAFVGMSIGFAFMLAFLLGPWLDAHIKIFGIFQLSALFGCLSVFLLGLISPAPATRAQLPVKKEKDSAFYLSSTLWSLNVAIFMLHAVLTALFLILSLKIQVMMNWPPEKLWQFYLPVLVIGIGAAFPFLGWADKAEKSIYIKRAMFILGAAACVAITFSAWISLWIGAVLCFFIAFNFLEASLPARISRIVPLHRKGSALGLYSCSQFLGMFCGGVAGGALLQAYGTLGVGILCASFALISGLVLQWTERPSLSENKSKLKNKIDTLSETPS